MRKQHKLGVGHGRLIEERGGRVSYMRPGTIIGAPAFTVRLADVSGFSYVMSGVRGVLTVYGLGSVLGSVEVNPQTAERIERWFRSQPGFRVQ